MLELSGTCSHADLEMLVISSRTRIVLTSVLAVALLGMASGCSRKSETAGKGLSPASRAASETTSSATASDTPAPKLQSVSTTSSGGTGGTTKSPGTGTTVKPPVTGTGELPVTNDSGSSDAPAPDAVSDPKAGMKVLIMFWNDTDSKPLKSTEIVLGASTYKPATGGKTDQGTLGLAPYDESVMITVYPDGRSGKKIEVPIVVTKGMIANSEQDAIHVAVSDGSVRVLGNAVSNIDQVLPRF